MNHFVFDAMFIVIPVFIGIVFVVTIAIKEGLSGKKSYCKHCGTQIDKDSKFCKECGKEQ